MQIPGQRLRHVTESKWSGQTEAYTASHPGVGGSGMGSRLIVIAKGLVSPSLGPRLLYIRSIFGRQPATETHPVPPDTYLWRFPPRGRKGPYYTTTTTTV